jgi:membrane-bound serine protease (ClpP class)
MHNLKTLLRVFTVIFSLSLLSPQLSYAERPQPITVLNIKGAISPAYSDYLHRGLREAKKNNSQLLLIELDTPGGVLASTREMAQKILSSEIPIAVFVTPAGAHAASAGTFLLYAAHIAAMSPGTNTGAATPVSMTPPHDTKGTKDKGDQNKKTDAHSAAGKRNDGDRDARLAQKSLEDTSAFIRALANFHDRNTQWAEKAVIEADSLIAEEALEKGVIDYLAPDRQALIKQIDGKAIKLNANKQVILDVASAPVITFAPNWRTKLLALLTDPNIAYFLLIIGINGLILEFYNPGTMVAGVIGAVCLILALMSMHVLPINATGLTMVILGMLFLASEAFIPAFGILGIGGLIAFILGSLLLFDAEAMSGIGLNMSSIVIASGFSALLIGSAIYLLLKLRKLHNSTGIEAMLNSHATIMQWDGRHGKVELYGETWNARADSALSANTGDKITITGKDNLTLIVSAYNAEKTGD